MFALSIDPMTGQLGSEETSFPYGVAIEDVVVAMPQNCCINYLEGYAFDRWPGSEPIWKCVGRVYGSSPVHEGCGGMLTIDSKLPFLFSAAYSPPRLWSFPFSATQGPDLTKGTSVEFNLWPRQWFVIPESLLLIGFGVPWSGGGPREMFVFRINPQSGTLSRAPEPAGGFPQQVSAITFRPRPDN
jgi:hypothetical protein